MLQPPIESATRSSHRNGALLLNTEAANRWLALFANVSVLAGIVFLALEVRQANRIAIASTEMSVWGTYVSLNQMPLENEGVAALLVKASDRNAEFTSEENEKLASYLYSFIDTWYAIEIAYDNGMVSDTTEAVVRADIRNLLHSYPALGPLMRDFLNLYPEAEGLRYFAEIRQAVDESTP